MTPIKEPEVVQAEATALSHKILDLCAGASKIVIVDSLALALGVVLTDCDPRLHATIIARSNTLALNVDEHIRSNGPKDAR